jgi:ribosomal protein S18 acetylase RimI-like enzyme
MADPKLNHLDGAEASEVFEQVFRIYAIVYADPPYSQTDEDRAEFVTRAARHFKQPGFDLICAWMGNQMIGFTYGFTIQPASSWWDGIEPPQTEAFLRETGGRTFAVIELAVLPEFRGQGLGKRLIAELLRGRGEERATLATHPEATEVQRMYERWGWRKAGRIPGVPGAPCPYFDLYTLPLR